MSVIGTSAMACCERSRNIEELELSVLQARKSVNLRRRDSCGHDRQVESEASPAELGSKALKK